MKIQCVIFMILLTFGVSLYADDQDHQHEHEKQGLHSPSHEGSDHREENISYINDDLARQVGIVTAMASQQTLQQTVTVYGSLTTGPEQLSHVRARFEGMVKSVKVNIGDKVSAGDLLAEVESNENLKTYPVRTPITGLIVQRHANTGEATQDQVLFTIANFEMLWAELRIYPAQQAAISQGQAVQILANNQGMDAKINHVIPALEKPYQLARVALKNTELALSPGLLVEARVETGRFPVRLAVEKNAVQLLGGRQGVFTKDDDEYVFTPLVLGKKDDHFVEVLSGLAFGTEYVSQNSYLIKADLEKSVAEHTH